MRWPVFLLFAYVALALEKGLRQVAALDSLGGVSPSFAGCLVVFLAMFAPRSTALWGCWVLGVFKDLITSYPLGGNDLLFIIGPHALAYVFGCVLLLQVRSLVFRQRVLTFCVMALVCMIAVGIAAVAVKVLRSWYPEAVRPLYFETSALSELLQVFGIAFYTALLAIPLGWLLVRTMPLWGFTNQIVRRGSWAG